MEEHWSPKGLNGALGTLRYSGFLVGLSSNRLLRHVFSAQSLLPPLGDLGLEGSCLLISFQQNRVVQIPELKHPVGAMSTPH